MIPRRQLHSAKSSLETTNFSQLSVHGCAPARVITVEQNQETIPICSGFNLNQVRRITGDFNLGAHNFLIIRNMNQFMVSTLCWSQRLSNVWPICKSLLPYLIGIHQIGSG